MTVWFSVPALLSVLVPLEWARGAAFELLRLMMPAPLLFRVAPLKEM